jgi:hypothetical protein
MPVGEIPFWGQWGLLGISISLNVFFMARYSLGEWVSRKQLDQVQKMADTWQHGWEVAQSNQSAAAELLVKLGPLVDSFQHFIESLPAPEDRES